MWSEDNFQYAIENTQVILEPAGKIATFGSTSFRFFLISELMDRVNEVRVRDGQIHAERPQILTPEHYCRLLLEGFGEKAQRYVEQFRERMRNAAVVTEVSRSWLMAQPITRRLKISSTATKYNQP